MNSNISCYYCSLHGFTLSYVFKKCQSDRKTNRTDQQLSEPNQRFKRNSDQNSNRPTKQPKFSAFYQKNCHFLRIIPRTLPEKSSSTRDNVPLKSRPKTYSTKVFFHNKIPKKEDRPTTLKKADFLSTWFLNDPKLLS